GWANAMALEDALAETEVEGGEVLLAGGRYVHPGAATFAVSSNVTVRGGYDPAGTGARDLEAFASILDGDGQEVVVVTVGGANVVLEGIVITGARGVTSVGAQGLRKDVDGDFTMVDCVISNNVIEFVSSTTTGAYIAGNGTHTLRRCVIADNGREGGNSHSAQNAASGIVAGGGTFIIEGCRFSRQFCAGWGSRGDLAGALRFAVGTLRVSDTVFEENEAASHGGGGGAVWLGQYNSGAFVEASFSNCLFRANSFAGDAPSASPGNGGAVAIRGTDRDVIEFVHCVFVDNMAGNGNGGALYMNSGAVTLRNCIFWNNGIALPGYSGTEIYAEGGTLDADYLCLTGVKSPEAVYVPGQSLGANVIVADPLFASEAAPHDYHLKSEAGRWDPLLGDWVYTDGETSVCIDAGLLDGRRVNLGLYGNTAEASKSLMAEVPQVDVLEPAHVAYTRWSVGGILTNAALNVASVVICSGRTRIDADTFAGWDTVESLPTLVKSGVPFAVETPMLETEKTYYVRVYATNDFGEAWSDIASFVTGDTLPDGWGLGGGAEVIHVRADAVGDNDGTDWYNAFASVGDGFAALGGTRTNLWIAGGEYVLTMNAVASASCVILGGVAGTENAVGERTLDEGRAANPTVIVGGPFSVTLNANEGAMDNVTFTGFAMIPAFTRTGTGDFALSHFTFTNNVAPNLDIYRGFIAFSGGNVTMTRCTVSDNISTFWDLRDFGIQVNPGTSLAVFDSDISRNRGEKIYNTRGCTSFGISFYGTTLLVERTRFSENEMCAHGSVGGAALYLAPGAGTATIRHCLFEGNRLLPWLPSGNGVGQGSAIVVDMGESGTATLEHCAFVGNVTESWMEHDAAVVQKSGTLTLANTIFWENTWMAENAPTLNADVCAEGGITFFGYNSFTEEGSVVLLNGGTVPATTTLYGDPLFAGDGDYHLQSKAGRWDGAAWVKDRAHSPCIDAGLLAGKRINLGLY
ncbi:MAG: right-handed parallel beta-helix repeat-containing protein, partial [Kiritimatiellaeota bacterium]|nr:right-handed parallel beta-helix repeat-containing protein [Kiritimatiellota bacterium]